MMRRVDEEDEMDQQKKAPAAPAQPAAVVPQEFYLPRGGGIDPDFHVPAEREHVPGRLSRWVHSLSGFGRR
ncbi:hypothetical protein [Pseudarthrobacter sp. J64]|uniref:hypothetical protein n=1 Tax=Pseudarthrobacter sp. J64 TaxID=3116485 RepID=UPI002E816181|nr:hypothetical protein [Pseudarthrobacter sp. J64]